MFSKNLPGNEVLAQMRAFVFLFMSMIVLAQALVPVFPPGSVWAAFYSAPVRQGVVGFPIVTIDESGTGSVVFPGDTFPIAGTLLPDPGPGGLPSALTYSLLGPPDLVAGDLYLLGASGAISDVIRFNPAGTGSDQYPASVVYYSAAPGLCPADVGFPTSAYTNTATLAEAPGCSPTLYTPGATQPGYVPGFTASYVLLPCQAECPIGTE